MAKTRPETIVLKGDPILKEAQASAAISPGHVIEFGGAKDVQKQSTADKNTLLRVAIENDLIGGTIEDAYAANDNVLYVSLRPGDEAQLRVAASAAAIVKGDQLELTGDGTLNKLAAGTAVAEALEAVDNSSNANSEAFIKIEAL